MARDPMVELSPEDLRGQLSNWLRLIELSGTQEVVLERAVGGSSLAERGLLRDEAEEDGKGGTCERLDLDSLMRTMAACTRCGLHESRTNVVFGEGNPSSELMFIGEGPGRDEDVSGRPFVGRAGALLTRIIKAMGLERKDVYIANVVKCRPPGNRNPEPDEISECLPYLEKQVDLIRPKVICTLGNVATQTLTGTRSGITSVRGTFYDYRGIRLMPTFHPAACLRNPGSKKLVWQDIKKVMKELGLSIRGVMRDGPGKNKH